jgi:O-antigen/teichoic acid export membrane protein
MSKVHSGLFWSATNSTLVNFVAFFGFVVLGRLLSPAEFGIVAMAAAAIALAGIFVPLGMAEALIQRREVQHEHFDTIFWLLVGSAVLLYALCIVFADLAAWYYGVAAVAQVMPVLALRLPAEAINAVPQAIIARHLDFHLLALRSAVGGVVTAVTGVTLALMGAGIWALVLSQILGVAVSALTSMLVVKWTPRLRFSFYHLKQILSYGIPSSGGSLIVFLTQQIDQMVIGLSFGEFQMGIYNLARRIQTFLISLLGSVAASVAHPAFSRIQDDMAQVREKFVVSASNVAIIVLPIFVGIISVAHDALALIFGDKWLPAAPVVIVLCIWGPIQCVGMLQGSLISGLGRPDWWFGYLFGSALLNIPVCLLSAPHGITAVAVALVGKAYLVWPISVAMACRLLGLSPVGYLVTFVSPLCAAMTMLLAVLWLDRLEIGVPLLEVALKIGAGGLVYALTLYALAPTRSKRLVFDLVRVVRRRPVA